LDWAPRRRPAARRVPPAGFMTTEYSRHIGQYAKGETKTDIAHPAARLIIEWTAQL